MSLLRDRLFVLPLAFRRKLWLCLLQVDDRSFGFESIVVGCRTHILSVGDGQLPDLLSDEGEGFRIDLDRLK